MFLKDTSVYDGPFDLRQVRKNGFIGPIRAQIGQKPVKIVDLYNECSLKSNISGTSDFYQPKIS